MKNKVAIRYASLLRVFCKKVLLTRYPAKGLVFSQLLNERNLPLNHPMSSSFLFVANVKVNRRQCGALTSELNDQLGFLSYSPFMPSPLAVACEARHGLWRGKSRTSNLAKDLRHRLSFACHCGALSRSCSQCCKCLFRLLM